MVWLVVAGMWIESSFRFGGNRDWAFALAEQ